MTTEVILTCEGPTITTSDYSAEKYGMWSINSEPPRNLVLNTTGYIPWPQYVSLDGHYRVTVMLFSHADLDWSEFYAQEIQCGEAPPTTIQMVDDSPAVPYYIPDVQIHPDRVIEVALPYGGDNYATATADAPTLPATGYAPLVTSSIAMLFVTMGVWFRRWARRHQTRLADRAFACPTTGEDRSIWS